MRRDGLIVCNLHTVQGASRILIRYDNTGRRPARIVRVFPEYDLISLKIDPPTPLSPVRLADKQDVSLRQTVYHIGSSFLLDGTISEGRITGLGSSKSGNAHGNKDIDIIRLNIQLFKGDSGGPLFDQEGRLIGMVVAADTTRERVSFAVPANKIKKILSAP
ncbi:MAG: serine protease [Candidatus Omnitrophica bacterium]|nr:serine protease [Candidatus Omnitrophota bacterium]